MVAIYNRAARSQLAALQLSGGDTGMLTGQLAVYGDVSYQHEVSAGGFRGWAFNGGVRYSF